jgi:hypothetical protein
MRRFGGAVVVLLVLALLAGCGGDGADRDADTTPPDATLAPEVWAAAALVDLPDGLRPTLAEEVEGERRLTYADGSGDRYSWEVLVATSHPAGVARDESGVADPAVTTAEVRGHEALATPLSDDGRVYAQQVEWDERPDLRVRIVDARTGPMGEILATPQSALDLAERVQGLTEAEWQALLVGLSPDTHAGRVDPDATEVEMARGFIDAEEWVLVGYVPGGYPVGPYDERLTCAQLRFAGEASDVECTLPWVVVVEGRVFAIGSVPAETEAVNIQLGGQGGTLITVATVEVDAGPPLRFYVTELPPGTCVVTVAPFDQPEQRRMFGLTPGQPGSDECRIADPGQPVPGLPPG